MASTYKKSKGTAGLEGVQFQLDLLTVFSLNALHNCKDWKISSENEEGGKYDDIVIELPTKNVFLQAKHKQSKKLTRDQLFSSNSKNVDFSLSKYFFSYLEIKSEVKETTVILCTNTNINQKGLQDIIDSHRVDPDSFLHNDGSACPYFTFNKNILSDLRENAESYLEKNLQGKGLDKAIITDENMEEFLRNFQFFYNYPSGEELHKVIERLLHRLGDLCSRITYHEIYRKVEEWFKQPKGEYLIVSRTNAMLCEIRSEQYCNTLKNYNISFEHNDFDFSNLNQIIHIKTGGESLLQMLRIFQALQGNKAKQLYVNPEEAIEMQERMVEAFRLPQYVFLILVWQKNRNGTAKSRISSKLLREILEENRYKKVVLLTGSNVEIIPLVRLTDVSQIDVSVTFHDFSKTSREGVLKKENIVFQGDRVSLQELLESQTAEDYTMSLDTRMLEELVRAQEVTVGDRLLGLDEGVAQYYVHRAFQRETDDKVKTKLAIPEENLFYVSEKVVLVSDSAGMGKSTVLTKIATYIKQKNSHMWVLKMNLMDYTRILRDFLRKKSLTVTVEELMNSQEATKLKNRFEQFVFCMDRKVVLLLDGVDEVAPNYTRLILHLLQQCQEAANIAKVFATTRPHMTLELRAVLSVESFKMLPFTKQDQMEFLINYWTLNLQLKDTNETKKCGQYAEILIDKMSSWTQSHFYEENSIGALPLQVRMIADIFQGESMWESKDWESCREFLKAAEKEPKLPEKFDISRLYDMFIDKKRDIFLDRGNPTGNTTADQALMDQFDESLAHHRSLALKVILTEKDCNLFSTYQECNSSYVLKIGIVQRHNNNLFFVHRTFAEYFVATSVLQELQLSPSVEFQKFLIDQILVRRDFKVIRGFLDSCLQNVVDTLSPDVFAKYQSQKCEINVDLIFILAEEGCVAVLQLIFKSIQFTIVRDKKVDIEDLQMDTGDRITNTLNYLQTITRMAGVNIKGKDGETPLHCAARSGHWEMVKYLIDQGADVSITNQQSRTALHLTVGESELDTIKYLMKRGADIDIRDTDDRTPLHGVTETGKLNIVKCLVERGVCVNDRDHRGCTPLHSAVRFRGLAVTTYLIQRGADINIRDKAGRSALHWAAMGGELDTIGYLVALGLSVNIRDDWGSTPLHTAAQSGGLDIVGRLVDLGSDINITDRGGATVLHRAAKDGDLGTVEYLVKRGVNVNCRDSNGRTALHLAIRIGNFDVVTYLRALGDVGT